MTAWLVGLAVLALAGVVVARWRADAGESRLHRELARANRLTPAESRLLVRLGRRAGLEESAMLFVRPTLFERTAKACGVDPDTVQAIRAKVYSR